MVEKTLENQTCWNCGVKVRPDTLFCYNCGSSVSPENSNGSQYPTVKDKLLEEDLSATIAADKNSAVSKESRLKSAASLQQKNKTAKKEIEVVWEEPQTSSNVWFLVVGFLLTLFAVGILMAMLYVR